MTLYAWHIYHNRFKQDVAHYLDCSSLGNWICAGFANGYRRYRVADLNTALGADTSFALLSYEWIPL